MNPLKTLCLLACLVAVASAKSSHRHKGNNRNGSLKPSEWISMSEVQTIPAIDELKFEDLERYTLEEGANIIDKIYHLHLISGDITPEHKPSPNNVPVYIRRPNGVNVSTTLDKLVQKVKKQPNFGGDEVTVFITGYPNNIPSVARANQDLVEAYMQRYKNQAQHNLWSNNDNQQRTSSEEDPSDLQSSQSSSHGELIVIDFGATIDNFKKWFMLNNDESGKMIGNVLAKLSEEGGVTYDSIRMVAQGPAAHVAGAACRQFARKIDQKVRRLTLLDPSKIFARIANRINGAGPGDAEQSVGIHTSVYGLGSEDRVGTVDFYPDGPGVGVSGAQNVLEASMRATHFFAESLRPGNERNFPAVCARSIEELRQNKGYGKRTYMGPNTPNDIKGIYILEVNPQSPYGKQVLPNNQNSYQ